MPNPSRPTTGALATAAAARAVCNCGGPLIVPGAVVALTGALTGNFWMLALGALVVLVAAGPALRRRLRRHRGLAGSDDSCPASPAAKPRSGR